MGYELWVARSIVRSTSTRRSVSYLLASREGAEDERLARLSNLLTRTRKRARETGRWRGRMDKAHQGYKVADCCETENEQQRSQSYQRHHPARLPSAAPQAAEGRSLLPRDQKLRFLPGRIARTIDRTSLSYAYPASQKPAVSAPGPASSIGSQPGYRHRHQVRYAGTQQAVSRESNKIGGASVRGEVCHGLIVGPNKINV